MLKERKFQEEHFELKINKFGRYASKRQQKIDITTETKGYTIHTKILLKRSSLHQRGEQLRYPDNKGTQNLRLHINLKRNIVLHTFHYEISYKLHRQRTRRRR